MKGWDFKIQAWLGGKLRLETVHRGVSSMEIELEVFHARLRRGDFTQVVVTDLRPAWVRAQHGPQSPWALDLSQVLPYAPRNPHY